MIPALLAILLSGCIVSVEDNFCVTDDVDEIVIDVSNGDVTLTSGPELCVSVDVGGVATTEVTHKVKKGVLYLDYDCSACGGDIVITAPKSLLVDVAIGTGNLRLEGRGGDVYAAVGAGEVTSVDMTSRFTELVTAAGSVRATWAERPEYVSTVVAVGEIDIVVPTGEYDLDLESTAGPIDISGIDESKKADAKIVALASAGAITIRGK